MSITPSANTCPTVAKRIDLERRIARRAVNGLLEAGYQLSVFDGEEITVKRSEKPGVIMHALGTTDEDKLIVHAPRSKTDKNAPRVGFVWLVYGNSGYDLIADFGGTHEHFPKIEAALKSADDYAAKYDI
jgi:hypothetical protein